MTSAKQIEANQANAQHSTGPRTEEGKSHTRLNALKHGLRGLMHLLPDEDQLEYAGHCEGIYNSLEPATELEARLAQSIADDYWRTQRIRRLEQNLLNSNQLNQDLLKQLNLLSLYESRITRNIKTNNAEYRRLQSDRRAREQAELHELMEDAGFSPGATPENDNGSVRSTSFIEYVENEIAEINRFRKDAGTPELTPEVIEKIRQGARQAA